MHDGCKCISESDCCIWIWKTFGEDGAKLPLNAAVKDGSCKRKIPKCCRHDGCNAVDEPEGGWWVKTEEDKSPDDATGELPARPESVRWFLQPRQGEGDDIESHHATFGQRGRVDVKEGHVHADEPSVQHDSVGKDAVPTW